MDDIQFNTISKIIADLNHMHELVHSNSATAHVVHYITYEVTVYNIEKGTHRTMTQDESAEYLYNCGNARQSKSAFINNMHSYIISCALSDEGRKHDYSRQMNYSDIDEALNLTHNDKTYHFNGQQLHVNQNGRVVVYDFTTATVTVMSKARSWNYQRENKYNRYDWTCVQYASNSAIRLIQGRK